MKSLQLGGLKVQTWSCVLMKVLDAVEEQVRLCLSAALWRSAGSMLLPWRDAVLHDAVLCVFHC